MLEFCLLDLFSVVVLGSFLVLKIYIGQLFFLFERVVVFVYLLCCVSFYVFVNEGKYQRFKEEA